MLTWMRNLTLASRIALAPDGEGGAAPAEGGGEAQGGQPGPANTQPPADGGQQQAERTQQPSGKGEQRSEGKQPQQPTKPDWMPDKLFGDGSQFMGEDGSLDYEGMGKALSESYRQAENKIFTRKDDLKKEVAQELQQEQRANVPESPDRYQPDVPQDILPEGSEVNIDDNDPILQEFKQKAHDVGLSNEQFNELFQTYVKAQVQSLPDVEQEVQRLGDYGPQRVERVERWMQTHLSENAQQQMQTLAVNADTVALFEEMMELSGEPKFQTTQDGEVQEGVTMDDLKKLQASEEYRRGDKAVVQKVRNGYQKLAQQRARGGR